MISYEEFLESKRLRVLSCGIDPQDQINPKLFKFQADIVKWALKKGKAAIFAGCGLGKTAIQLEWARHIHLSTGGDVLILAPLAVAPQTVEEGRKFDIAVNLAESSEDIKPGINITNYEKLHKFDVGDFVGVVMDECFPPETPIEVFNTEKVLTLKRIDAVKEGDHILNAFGEDYVKSTYKRRINRAVRITSGKSRITCSENHPFFTMRGWRCAQDLQSGDLLLETREAMRLVRCDVSGEVSGAKNAKILREILFSELENEPAGDKSEGSQSRGRQETGHIEVSVVQEWKPGSTEGTEADSRIESVDESGDAQENFTEIACDEAQTFRAWGKWSSDDLATADNDGCSIRELDSGICYITGKTASRFSDVLQGRLRQSRLENRNRTGWGNPQIETGTGHEERSEIGFIEVDSIEILEQGHPELEKYRDADGYIYFYDIKASRHPSFSVNGILVHNSSILKSYNGKTRTAIIEAFKDTPYKLACTATPSPNDYSELGNHAEFLGVMRRPEMLATFFVHDSKPSQHHKGQTIDEKWRLKGHAVKAFWEWVASWAVMMQKPSDLGYEDGGFTLPELRYHQITVRPENSAFDGEACTLQERRAARKESIEARLKACSEVPNGEKLIIWCGLNLEQDALRKHFGSECVSIQGSTDYDDRLELEQKWRLGDIPIMISKPSVFGFGVNWQHCHRIAFVGLSDSFEELYQAVRRCWRFGQTSPVDVYVITSEAEGAVVRNIETKEKKFEEMLSGMIGATQEITKANLKATSGDKDELEHDVTKGNGWEMRLGDCCEELKTLADESIHYSIFSPPFKNIFIYSNSDRDVGNCKNADEFQVHMGFVASELHRVLKPGRLVSVHCADIPAFKYKEGFAGLQDLPGMLIRIFQEAGFVYHSRVTIYKSPVTEMYRTKTQGLLYKQLKKDSAVSRQGLADYIITMRKLGDNLEPVTHTDETFPLPAWQKYADPVWMDICQTNTLNNKSVREYEDEKHICPLQLDVIDRCLELWSNPGEVVLSPFAGIGSEGYAAIQAGRQFIGIELKRSYYEQACDYMTQVEAREVKQVTTFKFKDEKKPSQKVLAAFEEVGTNV